MLLLFYRSRIFVKHKITLCLEFIIREDAFMDAVLRTVLMSVVISLVLRRTKYVRICTLSTIRQRFCDKWFLRIIIVIFYSFFFFFKKPFNCFWKQTNNRIGIQKYYNIVNKWKKKTYNNNKNKMSIFFFKVPTHWHYKCRLTRTTL